MGMSTYVEGVKPPDEKWKQMKSVYDACVKAKVNLPDEVEAFFAGESPDPKGVIVSAKDMIGAVTKRSAEGRDIWEVDLSKLPLDVKIVRFTNSY